MAEPNFIHFIAESLHFIIMCVYKGVVEIIAYYQTEKLFNSLTFVSRGSCVYNVISE